MKRLLVISWEMPPLSGPRAVQVTRTLVALARMGYRSRVICFGPQSDRYHQTHRVSIERLSNGGARLLPVASPEEWLFFRALWRVLPVLKRLPDEKRVWVPGAIAEARRALAEQPADAIVSFAQPWSDHLIGLALQRETGLPWVAHFSDPWSDSPYQSGSGWARQRAVAMEAEVVAGASQLVFVNRYTLEKVMSKYPASWRDRAHVVPQGWESPASPPAAREPGAVLRMVYTGRFYPGVRTPDTFLEALSQINGERPLTGRIDVEFVGGDMAAHERRASALGLSGFTRFAGRLNPDEARARAANADVLLSIDAPAGEEPNLFLPSKLIDYLPLGKPILGLTPTIGASADVIRELGYRPVDPGDPTAIASAVRTLLDAHEAGTLAPSATHAQTAARFAIDETTRTFAGVLDAAIGAA